MDGQLLLPLNFMTDEEKGYHCPDNCPQCPYKTHCASCLVLKAEEITEHGKRNKWEVENAVQ